MVKRISIENNFSYLTVMLVVLFIVSALIDEYLDDFGLRTIQAVMFLTLIIGVWSLKSNDPWFRNKYRMALTLFIILIVNIVLDMAGLDFIQLLIILGFFIWTTYLASKQVLFTGIIDGNKIIGAICIYLLLGLTWGILYLLVIEVHPDSFSGLSSAPWHQNFSIVTYYSFVTLTTLGYGEISPALPVARALAFLEAVAGVFYMAILVASLIGVRMSEQQKKK